MALPAQPQLPRPQPGTRAGATLADRLCALLEQGGAPMRVPGVVAGLLHLRGCPPPLQRRLVAEIVDADPRLAWHGHDRVGLAAAGGSGGRAVDATYCVVDLETTGGSPGVSQVTEIGAVRLEGLRVVARFQTLVDPGRPIPAIITEITGIDDAMVAGQPAIPEALERFVDFCGTDVMVAHNAAFDLRFLNYERHRLAGRYFTQGWIDTLALARRVVPRDEVDRYDLASLCSWAGTLVRPRHRALEDAEATAELLATLLQRLSEQGHPTMAAALDVGQPGGGRHAHKLALTEDLPRAPGVFVLRDSTGTVLHVGRAANLRRHVRAYVAARRARDAGGGALLERLARVEHEVFGSEFQAALREIELRATLAPALGGRSPAPRYFRLHLGRLSLAPAVTGDGAEYFGPFRSTRMATAALEGVHRLFPLRPRSGARAEDGAGHVVRLRELLTAPAPRALDLLSQRIESAVATGEVVLDAEGRDAVEALVGAVAWLSRVAGARGCRGILLEPGAEPRTATLFLVNAGRVVDRVRLCHPGWWDDAARGLADLARRRPVPDPAGAEEALLVADRLAERRKVGAGVVLADGWDVQGALGAIRDAVEGMLA